MTVQTVDNNPILRYVAEIESGTILVPRKVRKVYTHHAERVLHPDHYFYAPHRAEHIVQFIERFLRHSKGSFGGKRIELELWQKAFYSLGWGFIDEDGLRQFQRIILLVAKKNGKSLMGSAAGIYGMMADGEPGADVYSVATTREQAKMIWEESRKMIAKSPILKKRVRSLVNGIYYDDKESSFRALASDKDTLDGLNVHYALMDELHQWKNGRGLWDIIVDGTSARTQPMVVAMSTAGTVRDDLYDELYEEATEVLKGYGNPEGVKDDRLLPVIYELDHRKEWEFPQMWVKANPNLGVSKITSNLEDAVQRAKNNPRLVKNLLTKEFNIPETSATTWLSLEEITNHEKINPDDLQDAVVIGGFDLSVRNDLTAAVISFMKPNDPKLYNLPMFWMPEDTFESHIINDKVPYDIWHDEGLLTLCPGNQVDYSMVTKWFVDMRDKYDLTFLKIGYDPAYSHYIVPELQRQFGKSTLDVVRQGAITLGMPMATIEKLFRAGHVVYNDNKLMRWNLTCVSVKEDSNGNILPVKRQQHIQRIDGFMAILFAWTSMQRNDELYRSYIEAMAS